MVPDPAQVQGTGAAHPGTAGGRQDRPGDPAVFGTWPTLDEPGLHHPIDQPGDAARAQPHVFGEFVHPKPLVGRDFLFVTQSEMTPATAARFAAVSAPDHIIIPLGPDQARRYFVYDLSGFKGYR